MKHANKQSTPATYNAEAVRAARVDAVQATLYARHVAAKQAAHAQRTAAANKQAYLAQVAALAAQYNIAVPTAALRTVNGSATNIATKHAPSAKTGATHRVRELAAECNYDRQATLAAAAAEGINPNTAATQYAAAKKAHVQAIAAQELASLLEAA